MNVIAPRARRTALALTFGGLIAFLAAVATLLAYFGIYVTPFGRSPTPTAQAAPTVFAGQILYSDTAWSTSLSNWSGGGSWLAEHKLLVSNCATSCTLIAPVVLRTADYRVDVRFKIDQIAQAGGFFGIVARVQGYGDQSEGYVGSLSHLKAGSAGTFTGTAGLDYIGGLYSLGSQPVVIGAVLHEFAMTWSGVSFVSTSMANTRRLRRQHGFRRQARWG